MKPRYGHYSLLLLLAVSLSVTAAENLLIDAVRHGDSDAVKLLLEQPLNANYSEADGATPLHWAVHRNDMETASILIKAGANPDFANDYGVTPLWLACTNSNSRMVETLLQAGANPDTSLWTGETVLMKCSLTGAVDGVVALLAKGVNVNARENQKGQTALMWAASAGHAAVVEALIDHGAEVNSDSINGFTPLLFAARSGDMDTARILIEAGANPDESSPEFGNSMLVASAGGHEELALYLLQQGANPNASDQNGITPLHQAIRAGYSALNGVRYDAVYRVRPSNMHILTRALLEAGADPNAQIEKSYRLGPDGSPFNMAGATPFFLAAVSADVKLMRLLEEYEADPHINASGGVTLLMAAARAACTGSCAFQGGNRASEEEINIALQAVKTVVEMGVDINATDEDGQSAMHMAAFTGADLVVEYLAEHGADVNARNHYGETPWSMASGISPVLRYRGLYGTHKSTVTVLEKLGAMKTTREEMDSNAPPPPGQ